MTPGLGTILVGDDGPSANYVVMKHRDCAELGMASVDRRLPADATQAEVEAAIDELNATAEVDAFIVQYPFPAASTTARRSCGSTRPRTSTASTRSTWACWSWARTAPLPARPAGILRMLHAYDVPIGGRHVVIVGRGLTIGRPLANLLSLKRPDANAAVTVVHTGVDDIGAYTRTADIVVAAAGSPGLITADMVRPGAAVVAAGVSFQTASCRPTSPTTWPRWPGGCRPASGASGPMTRAMLLVNTRRRRRASRYLSGSAPPGAASARMRPQEPMTSIVDLLDRAGPTLSVEFFPPKTDERVEALSDHHRRARASPARPPQGVSSR